MTNAQLQQASKHDAEMIEYIHTIADAIHDVDTLRSVVTELHHDFDMSLLEVLLDIEKSRR